MADYSVAAHSSCEAEVAELHDVIAAHQDVLRLHIAVYHARLVRVEVMQSLREVSKNQKPTHCAPNRQKRLMERNGSRDQE